MSNINSRKHLKFYFLNTPRGVWVVSIFSHYFSCSKHIYALDIYFLEGKGHVLFSFIGQKSKIVIELATSNPPYLHLHYTEKENA